MIKLEQARSTLQSALLHLHNGVMHGNRRQRQGIALWSADWKLFVGSDLWHVLVLGCQSQPREYVRFGNRKRLVLNVAREG